MIPRLSCTIYHNGDSMILTQDRFFYFRMICPLALGFLTLGVHTKRPKMIMWTQYRVNLKWKMAEQENNVYGEHLGVWKCPGERPTKILHGKGTDRRGRPGFAIGMFIAMLLYSLHTMVLFKALSVILMFIITYWSPFCSGQEPCHPSV